MQKHKHVYNVTKELTVALTSCMDSQTLTMVLIKEYWII